MEIGSNILTMPPAIQMIHRTSPFLCSTFALPFPPFTALNASRTQSRLDLLREEASLAGFRLTKLLDPNYHRPSPSIKIN
jgi:hypothetical protein